MGGCNLYVNATFNSVVSCLNKNGSKLIKAKRRYVCQLTGSCGGDWHCLLVLWEAGTRVVFRNERVKLEWGSAERRD